MLLVNLMMVKYLKQAGKTKDNRDKKRLVKFYIAQNDLNIPQVHSEKGIVS